MARRVIHQLVDDLDGTTLEAGAGENVTFALDNRTFEIDLSATHAAELREALEPYISAGRRVNVGRRAKRAAAREDLDEIRAWARANGHDVSVRGRVPVAVVAAFDAR